MGGLAVLGALSVFILPETIHRKMPDTIEEARGLSSSKSEIKEVPDQNLPDICEVDEMDTGKENYI